MATRTVTDCDKCKKRDVACVNISLPVRRYTDAAGSADTEYIDADLCFVCIGAEFLSLVRYFNYEQAQDFFLRVKGTSR